MAGVLGKAPESIVPPPANLFARVIARHARDRPLVDALVFAPDAHGKSGSLNFLELHTKALAFAERLTQLVPDEEPVLLMVRTDADSIVALCACLYAGIACVPLPTPTRHGSRERLEAVAAAVGASSIIAPRDTSHLRVVLPGLSWIDVDDSPYGQALVPRAHDASSLAIIQFTSGSTSTPKGSCLTYANVVANLEMLRNAFSVGPDDRFASWLPLFHDMGIVPMLLTPLYCGVPGIFMPSLSFVRDPLRWLRMVDAHGATITGAPNFAFEACVRRASDADVAALDLRRCRLAFCGAEPIRRSTMVAFAGRFAPAGFRASALYPCYGLAEATCLVAGGFLFPDGTTDGAPSEGSFDHVSCASPAKECVVAIVDPGTSHPRHDREEGEIWVHGPHVASGYWKLPNETRACFGATLADWPGRIFLRTGDLGFLADGRLTISGRLKDVIIHRGTKIHAVDVEATVAACHPGFGDVGAAFAIAVDGAEHVVLLHEAARHQAHLPREAMRAAADDAVALHHGVRLHDLLIVRPGSLPKTTSGKIRRSRCRDLYLQRAVTEVT